MLMLVFRLGEDRFALDTSRIAEIVPSVVLRKLPHAPAYVAGIFNHRGTVVPVIDLCGLMQDRPSRDFLSTRIVLVRPETENESTHLLGLRAEGVTETLKVAPSDLVDPGITLEHVPYLGKIVNDAQGMIQCIKVEKILPAGMMDLLFSETVEQP